VTIIVFYGFYVYFISTQMHELMMFLFFVQSM